MKLSAILFDLDGTLTDSIGLIVHCYQQTLTHFADRTLTREEIIPKIGRALPTLFAEENSGDVDEMLTFYRALYAREHESWVRLYDGVEEMLATLHSQLPLALVTSKSLQSARPALERFGIGAQMQVIITSDDTQKHKPDPEPLLLAATRLGIAPETLRPFADQSFESPLEVLALC
ncbi:HAD-IA family hydrolase [Armatimonas sp.]|uniref:HAD-IA family hydrolase n=1 Tax=Armatimonas sp. TaxID=1872638 RepID=UPI003751D9DD